jgi:hypothetical protein
MGIMAKTFAGIGSRQTPASVLLVMQMISRTLESHGYFLHSGGAIGADQAFELGYQKHGMCCIWRPEHASREAFDMAAKFHPNWAACSSYAMALHARNCHIVLGKYLDDPVNFIVCWTKDGKASGGTGQALRIAEAYKIPVFNLFNDPSAFELMAYINATRA